MEVLSVTVITIPGPRANQLHRPAHLVEVHVALVNDDLQVEEDHTLTHTRNGTRLRRSASRPWQAVEKVYVVGIHTYDGRCMWNTQSVLVWVRIEAEV